MARWFPFEHFREFGWHDEPVVSCHLGKIFQFTEGRSAWWGSHSNRYPGIKSFWPRIEEAQAEIELRRKQGSQWHIRELPVLVISGEQNSLLVGEINADEPLWRFLKPRTKLLSLEQSGRYFAPRRPDSVIRIVCESDLMPVATRPFHVYRSISHGGRDVSFWWTMRILEDGSIDRTARTVRRLSTSLAAACS